MKEQIRHIRNVLRILGEWIAAAYVICMGTIFTLYTHHGYYDVLASHLRFFRLLTLLLGIPGLLIYLSSRFLLREKNSAAEQTKKDGPDQANSLVTVVGKPYPFTGRTVFRKALCPTDLPLTILVLIYLLSMLLSGYPYETFWGNRGRSMGVLMILILFLSYLLVTRLLKPALWQAALFIAGGAVVLGLGVTDFFKMNVLGFFDTEAARAEMSIFASTIGNINTYTSYTAMIMALSSAFFITEKNPWLSLLWFAAAILGNIATIFGISDNAVLSFAGFYLFALLVLVKARRELSRFALMLVTSFLCIAFAGYLVTVPNLNIIARPGDSILLTIGSSRGLMKVFLGSSIAFLLLVLFYESRGQKAETEASDSGAEKKRKISVLSGADLPVGRLLQRFFRISALALILITVFLFVLANHGVCPELWTGVLHNFILSDDWGTGRGMVWHLGMQYYLHDMTLLQKIFGYGPDTCYLLMMDHFLGRMQAAGYGMFDSAHNEYLNLLLTVGITGMLSYLWLLFTGIREMVRSRSRMALVLAAAVVTYAAQAFVNIAVPIVYPVFFVLFSMGVRSAGIERREK